MTPGLISSSIPDGNGNLMLSLIYTNFCSNVLQTNTFVYMLLLLLLHKTIHLKQEIKYFIIHIITNAIIVYLTASDTLNMILNPTSPYVVVSSVPVIVWLLHVYHWLNYKLTADDMTHHIVNVFISCPLMMAGNNSIAQIATFFMSGLPGGTIYCLLVLKEYGYLTKLQEKRISKHINLWIRAPGCVIVSYISLLYCVNGMNICGYAYGLEFAVAAFLTIAVLWNGMYFCSTIVASEALAKKSGH